MSRNNGNTGSLPSPRDENELPPKDAEELRHLKVTNKLAERVERQKLSRQKSKTIRYHAGTVTVVARNTRATIAIIISILALLGLGMCANGVATSATAPAPTPSVTMESGELGQFAHGLSDGQRVADAVRFGLAAGEAAGPSTP
ncbi:hypothetical protein GCM10025867_49700 (plasmid) [Frondihabitans sucicola]|uniref:DUF3040 domain-containing protein n=2 Tax=Frondihabitans sucicola TaxID=1268041 RepID=A0ABM8GWC6_9MICO|nr:hypothetical protein GCM10025867_49700 [Frondihabitans sucicola]